MNLHIKLEGLENLEGKLNRLVGGAGSGFDRGLKRAGEIVRAEAVMNCPADSTQLKQSIAVEQPDGTSVVVGTNLEYGVYVEFGTGSKGDPSVAHTTKPQWVYFNEKSGSFVTTSGQPARPFLVPALISQQEEIVEAIKQGLLETI